MAGWRSSFGIGIDVKGVEQTQAFMGRMVSWANVTIPQLTNRQANAGAKFAAGIAPKQTHALVQAISSEPGNKGSYRIVSRTPKGQVGRTVPYHLYLAYGKHGRMKTPPEKPSGDYQYMAKTAEMLSEKYPDLILKSLRQTINKK